MKIIISPTKKMMLEDSFEYRDLPVLLENTKQIKEVLSSKSDDELKKLWGCNQTIASENISRLQHMNLESNLSPAILSYIGIQFQYMSPNIFTNNELEYIQDHLRILSGFYGILKPFDGITPYRLEMGTKLKIEDHKDLYDYWNDALYKALDDDIIINLASNEYSKCISKYLKKTDTMIDCYFGFMVNGKFKVKATYAKMARGEMVSYMAKNNVETVEALKNFNELDFKYDYEMSDETHFYFVRDDND